MLHADLTAPVCDAHCLIRQPGHRATMRLFTCAATTAGDAVFDMNLMRRFVVGWSALLLAACAAPDPTLRGTVGTAYAAIEPDTVVSATYGWSQGARLVRVVVCTPAHATHAPLLVYLPALGESSDAALRWRTAWATAGYAVMSLQALDEDAAAWSSDLARAGDFKALGRQRYGDAEMARRVQTIAAVVGDARRRATAGDAVWRGVDWSRVAIAGFDLGAYTALTIAAGRAADSVAALDGLPVRAVIALSPLARAVGAAPDTRYATLRSAVLTVTSDADADPLGLVSGAHARRTAFDLMQGPDKFLLSLQGPTHAELGGEVEHKASRSGSAGAKPTSDTGQRRRKGNKRSSPDDAATPRGDDADDGESAAALSPAALQSRMAAAQAVSIAFLDAYVRDAPRARQWLDGAAAQSLAVAGGELLRK